MRYHSQNLNEKKGQPDGSMFWHGRAWFYANDERRSERLHVEWMFGKFARGFAITATFGSGDSDAGVCLHVCIPWLFSIFVVFPYVYRCREYQTGIASHNGSFWIYPFVDQMESRHDFPWWKRNHAFNYPWTYCHHVTEFLEHKRNGTGKAVWDDSAKNFMETYDQRKAAQASVSETYEYRYMLKNGQMQKVQATVYVSRTTWRMRGWPLLRFKKVRTCIWVDFDGEVGEGTGSWKGGTTGCGYNMLPGEHPLECLRRMERERKFDR